MYFHIKFYLFFGKKLLEFALKEIRKEITNYVKEAVKSKKDRQAEEKKELNKKKFQSEG